MTATIVARTLLNNKIRNTIYLTFMNFNNFTIKSQEAIQKAFELTKGNGNQAIEPVHLLKGVIEEGESLVKFIFAKVGANLPR